MNNKKKRHFDKRFLKKKPKYKMTFISLDDPRVMREVEKKIYQEYLRKLNSESGDDSE